MIVEVEVCALTGDSETTVARCTLPEGTRELLLPMSPPMLVSRVVVRKLTTDQTEVERKLQAAEAELARLKRKLRKLSGVKG